MQGVRSRSAQQRFLSMHAAVYSRNVQRHLISA
jgi:hypothetical protein